MTIRRGFKSLTTRMIAWVLLASGIVFVTAVAISSRLSQATAVRGAEQEAFNAAEAARHRVLAVLGSVERSTELLGSALETLQPDRQTLETLLQRFVSGNPDIYRAPGRCGEPVSRLRRRLAHTWRLCDG